MILNEGALAQLMWYLTQQTVPQYHAGSVCSCVCSFSA